MDHRIAASSTCRMCTLDIFVQKDHGIYQMIENSSKISGKMEVDL